MASACMMRLKLWYLLFVYSAANVFLTMLLPVRRNSPSEMNSNKWKHKYKRKILLLVSLFCTEKAGFDTAAALTYFPSVSVGFTAAATRGRAAGRGGREERRRLAAIGRQPKGAGQISSDGRSFCTLHTGNLSPTHCLHPHTNTHEHTRPFAYQLYGKPF